MKSKFRLFAIVGMLFSTGLVTACDPAPDVEAPEVVTIPTDDADECPRADGQPCK